ncbi:MAG: hypothetical protein JNM84_12895 [Planctomycetes bacterium]|nr:hypothetical protein [Planctomycetota bacterium]
MIPHPYGLRCALGAAALALPLLASGCNTYILWQDARSSNQEWLEEEPLPTYAWFGADGALQGLVVEPSENTRTRMRRLQPSAPAMRWLLLQGTEDPEAFEVLARRNEDERLLLSWVQYADGSPGRFDLVQGSRTNRLASREDLPWPSHRHPSHSGPVITRRQSCRVSWIEEPPKGALLATMLRIFILEEQVQDDDLGSVAKLALTPLTLVVDLPFLPFQLLGLRSWFP